MDILENRETGERGVHAAKSYKKGQVIHSLQGEIFLNPTRESIYVGDNMHILDEYGQFINHSFTPSAIIQGFDVVALRDIKRGDEITFNYNENEINMAAPFEVDGVKVCGRQPA